MNTDAANGESLLRRAERWMAIGAAIALVMLMVVVLVDVIGRNAFNRPLASGTELTEMLMATLAFLSFPLLTYRQRDITVDLLDMLATPHLRRLQVALAGSVGTIVFALMAWQLVVFAQRAARSGEATSMLKVPMAWIYACMGLLAAVSALAALTVAVRSFTRHPVEPIKPREID